MNFKKSFTLVELMIVIAILAILAAIVIFALNPTELFKKNRDSRRMADLQTLNKGISFMTSWNTTGITLGTSTFVYLSLPDSSPTCSSYSLATLPTGYSYACVTSTTINNVDSTGWVPVNFAVAAGNNYLSKLPVDPTNDTNYYYSYNPGGSFELNAFFESNSYISKYGFNDGGDSMNALELGTNLFDMPQAFPHNWIKVPGNSLYSTNDFWVMQYEAKYSITGKSASDSPLTCRYQADYDGLQYGKTTGGCADYIPSWKTTNIVSSPYGSPISGPAHSTAVNLCSAIGGHLITNDEWMTIARNIEQQPANWTSGVVGTGYLNAGNCGDATRGYKAFADRFDLDKGVNRNPRASHDLSNGNKIFDFGGNLYERVMLDINNTLMNTQPKATGTNNNVVYSEYASLISFGDFSSVDDLGPSNLNWDSDQAIGKVSHYDGDSDANYTSRVIRRGSHCYNQSWNMPKVGIFSAFLTWTSGTGHDLTGFRCAR